MKETFAFYRFSFFLF